MNNGITAEQREKFLTLACRLSPENLCCDGEISAAQARRKAKVLNRQWKELEGEVGRKVSEDEVWRMELEQRG